MQPRLTRSGGRRWVSALLCAALAMTGTGCDNATAGPAAGGSVLKVGYLGDLSGIGAALGQPGSNGVQMAIDELNARGGVAGRPLALVTVDDRGEPDAAVAGAQELVGKDRVIAVLGGTSAATVSAATPVIAAAGVPQLITAAQEDALLDNNASGFPLTFRVTESTSYDVDAIASLLQARGYGSICVLADGSAHGDAGVASIQSVFATRGLPVFAVDRIPTATADLVALVTAMRDKGCNAVYLYSAGGDGAHVVKAMAKIGWRVPVVGGRELAAKSFLAQLGGATIDGLILPGLVDPARPAGKAFIAAYDRRFGAADDPAHVFSALGYDAMMLLATALEATGGVGGTRLAAALETATLDDAAGGRPGSTLSFSTNRHSAPGRDFIVFYEVRGGAFRFLTSDVSSGR